jgi:hypothetical protein
MVGHAREKEIYADEYQSGWNEKAFILLQYVGNNIILQ